MTTVLSEWCEEEHRETRKNHSDKAQHIGNADEESHEYPPHFLLEMVDTHD